MSFTRLKPKHDINFIYGLQAKEQRQAKEAQVAKAQMDAARRGGVSWGMPEEAALEENLEDVTEGMSVSAQTKRTWKCIAKPESFQNSCYKLCLPVLSKS